MSMITIDSVASLSEIGANLERQRISSGVSDKEVAAAAGVVLSTLGRWKTGEGEPGARSLALAAVSVGCTPNDILLRELPKEEAVTFDAEEIADLSRALRSLKTLKRFNPGPLSPVKIFADGLEGIEKGVLELVAKPIGTEVINAEGDVTVMNPPSRSDRQRTGETGKNESLRASEEPPQYGEDEKSEG